MRNMFHSVELIFRVSTSSGTVKSLVTISRGSILHARIESIQCGSTLFLKWEGSPQDLEYHDVCILKRHAHFFWSPRALKWCCLEQRSSSKSYGCPGLYKPRCGPSFVVVRWHRCPFESPWWQATSLECTCGEL